MVTGLFVALTLGSAQAQTGFEEWFARNNASGDWGGARGWLTEKGVDVELNYTTDILGNPVGGLRQNAAYAGMWYGSTVFDLEKLAGIEGLTFNVAGAWTQGRDLSGDDIGNLFGVAQIFNGRTLRLAEIYLEQSLFEDRLSLAVGHLAAGNDFAVLDAYGNYVNSAVNGNPTGILVNAPSFTTSPFAQWGVRAKVELEKSVYFSGGLYNADPDVQEDSAHGVDFTLNPQDGVLILGEAGWTPNSAGGSGLPGHYAAGGYIDTSTYQFIDDPHRSDDGNYGFYALAQQMVFKETAGSPEGLTLWATINVAPSQNINTLPIALFGGAYYQGLLPKRPNDVTAFGISYAAFSDDLPGQTYELALEVNHSFQVGNWFVVQPDLQYIINPNGGGIKDALVAGVQVSVDF